MQIKYWMLYPILLGWGSCYASTSLDIQTQSLKSSTRFSSWQGIEPDKWATLWLIKRHIVPDAYFILVPPNSDLPNNAYSFGVPESPLRRANRDSMFRRLKQAMQLDSEALTYLDEIIHDVEVNIWDAALHPHASWFETMYRKLQARYERDQVPVDCYLAFFDGVEDLSLQSDAQADDYQKQLALDDRCPGTKAKQNAYIKQLTHEDVLREISLGKYVVFVDTREDEEYNEVHLPDAQILRLRDIDADSVQPYVHADLVVPYCVKDFRGFEVAKSMKQLGIERVATLSPSGLKGWLKAGLPVARAGDTSDQQAMDKLMRCAMEPSNCLQESAKQ
ncbi:MAG: chromate resistance protein ChrB domain-containing protein [Sedimenticola sp.]